MTHNALEFVTHISSPIPYLILILNGNLGLPHPHSSGS